MDKIIKCKDKHIIYPKTIFRVMFLSIFFWCIFICVGKVNAATYTVEYYQGRTKLTSSTHTVGVAQNLTSYSGTAPNGGYSFGGWGTSTTTTTITYTDNQSVTNLSTTNGATVKLYAVFIRTIHAYSGLLKQIHWSSMSQHYNPYNNSVTGIDIVTPAGISKWTTLGYRADTSANIAEYSEAHNYQFPYNESNYIYSVYSRDLTIIYNGNGNTGGSTSNTTKTIYLNTNSTTTSSQTVTLANNGFTKTGYEFNKWALGSASGTKYSEGVSYTANLAYDADSFTKYMYATWTANTYTVKYNSNKPSSASGTVTGTTANSTHTYDVSKNLTLNGYSLSGWNFEGWNTKADGTGTNYSDGQSVKNLTATSGGVVNLYAQWTIEQSTVRIRKDNSLWSNSGIKVDLSISSTTDTATKSITATSSSITFSDLTDGTIYYIWAGKDSSNKTATIYTGASFVGGTGALKTINYYSVTLSIGTGISAVSNGGTNTTSAKQYLYKSSGTQQNIMIDSTVTQGYAWETWTKVSGTDPTTFNEETKSQNIRLGAGAVTLRASAVYTSAPTLSRIDYNSISYSATAGEAYFVSTSRQLNLSAGTTPASSTFALNTWTTATNTGDLNLDGVEEIYVYVKDAVTGGHVSNQSTITLVVSITRNQGTGTTLTTRLDSSSETTGTPFTDSSIRVIIGTQIWAKAEANTGYHDVTLKHGDTDMIAEGDTFNVSLSDQEISSTAVVNNTYKVEFYQGNNTSTAGATKLGEQAFIYGTPQNLTTYASLKTSSGKSEPQSFTFYGWSDHNGTTATSRTYIDAQSVNNLTETNNGVIKIYAIFSRTIKFNSGLNCATTSTAEQRYNPYKTTGSITAVSAPAPSMTGLSDTQLGWAPIGYRANKTAANRTYAVTTSATNITPAYNVYDVGAATSTTVNLYAVYSRTVTLYHGLDKAQNSTPIQYMNTSGNAVSQILAPAPSTTGLSDYSWNAVGYRTEGGLEIGD